MAFVPALVGGVELLDRGLVVAVLELTDLYLVDALEAVRGQPQPLSDVGGGLGGAQRIRVGHHPDRMTPVRGEVDGLLVAEIGERLARRARVETALHVGV